MKTIKHFKELNINPAYEKKREDYQNIALAVALGWTVDASTNQQSGLKFSKGEKHVWQTYWAGIHWQSASLFNNRYQNHKTFDKLETALKYF